MIVLQGNQTLLASESAHRQYKVNKGELLYFLAELDKDGQPGRRFLMAELGAGAVFPLLSYSNATEHWVSICEAIDSCEMEEVFLSSEAVKDSFLKNIDVELPGVEPFEEELVEIVRKQLVYEYAYLIRDEISSEGVCQDSMGIIYNLFHAKTLKNAVPKTRNLLYNTVAYLGAYEKIDVAEMKDVKNAYGHIISVEKIAQVSHFSCRSILLEEDWYKSDCGNLLLFNDKDEPLACIAKGIKKHYIVNLKTNEILLVDEALAQQIQPKGFVLYRSLPNKKLSYMDVIAFGLKMAKPFDLVNLLTVAFIGALIGLLIPYINEKLFDTFIPLGDASAIWQIGAVLIALVIGNLGFTIIKNISIFRFCSSMQRGTQNALYSRLFSFSQSFYNKFESADLARRAMDVSQAYTMLSEIFLSTMISGVFSVFYLGLMYKYAKELAGLGLLMVLINVGIVIGIGVFQVKYEKMQVQATVKSTSLLYQLIGGIAKIRIAGIEDRMINRYLKTHIHIAEAKVKTQACMRLATALCTVFSVVCSCIFYVKMIKESMDVTIGGFMAFLSAFGSFSAAIVGVGIAFLTFNSVIPLLKRAKPLLEELPEYTQSKSAVVDLNGKIEMDNISFRYSKEEEDVIKNLSLKIKPGEYIGVVGASGSGKSTLLKLLLGFETPTLGKIYYDNTDIDSLDLCSLRRKLGVVLQDGMLFTASIYENIAITGANIKPEQVMQVIRDVGLEKDIQEMPMGVHTMVAEGAGTISGGQKQRILIARAIINKPKIVFFDEATSALDNINQKLVTESIEKIKSTRIVIAHRLSTIENCDRILVMSQGEIVEQGTKAQLMEMKGEFYKLAVRQMVNAV